MRKRERERNELGTKPGIEPRTALSPTTTTLLLVTHLTANHSFEAQVSLGLDAKKN